MVHIKKLNDFINESQTRVKVNGSTNGRNEYEVKIAQEFTGAEYLFTVYANDEAQAIDLVLDLVSKRYKELVANVPSDFSNDWGYDDEGGYTTYGDDSPYVFNSEGTIAVNADGFEITERRGRMSESRASRRGRAINEMVNLELHSEAENKIRDIARTNTDCFEDCGEGMFSISLFNANFNIPPRMRLYSYEVMVQVYPNDKRDVYVVGYKENGENNWWTLNQFTQKEQNDIVDAVQASVNKIKEGGMFSENRRTANAHGRAVNEMAGNAQRSVSYGELAELENMFNDQIKRKHIVFSDPEESSQALFDFIQQYIEGNDNPQVSVM